MGGFLRFQPSILSKNSHRFVSDEKAQVSYIEERVSFFSWEGSLIKVRLRAMKILEFYTRFLYRARWPLAILFSALFVYCVFVSSHLKLKSDFKELLPENFQSVKDLDRIIKRAPGTGGLIVAIESDDPQSSIRFANALIEKLKTYPPDTISSIDYNAKTVKQFFEDHKYLYMDLEDLQELHDRLDRRIKREKVKHSGLFMSFQTEDEEKADFSTDDIEDKYKKKTANYSEYIDGYFFAEKGRLMAVIIKPPGASTGIDFSRKLVGRVEATIQELNPQSFNPTMKVGLTGKYKRVLYEYQTLIDDILSTALLCVALVSLAVFFYYRRFRMVWLMGWAVFNGCAWTFALTTWHIGYLNTQTAFLGSVIIGNGINHGLILMARYLEERKAGKNAYDSLMIAIPSTFAGTLASSCTTSVAFAVLIFTNIRGFSQFGFIGGLGMFLCWVAAYTVLPVFLSISEQIWPVVRENKVHKEPFSFMKYFSLALPRYAKQVSQAGIVFTLLSIPVIAYYIPHSLEYDFAKLRVQNSKKEMKEEAALNDRIRSIFGGSTTPSVLLVDREDQVGPLCDEIKRKNNLDPLEKQMVESCKSLASYVPIDQDVKIEWLQKIRKLLEGSSLNFLNENQKKEMEKFKSQFISKKVALKDVPEEVVRNFREKNGDLGKLVYVYPSGGEKNNLNDGKNLIHFADIIRKNTLPDGSVVTASGDSVIFSDLLSAVVHDGPLASFWAFVAVCLVVVLIFREVRACIIIIGTLVCGVLWMGALMPLFSIKINFFNFIAIPTTFGIGVDYGVNVYQRYKLEGAGSLPKVLRTTGGAVVLCSVTTIIGYATLIIAKNQALVSFGWIGILGEVTCIVSALVFVPALLIRREKKLGIAQKLV